MAYWIYSTYAVKSATQNVLNFVNEGLKNLGLEPKDNIKDAIERLWTDNDVRFSTFRPIPETFVKYGVAHTRYDKNWETNEPLFNSDEEYENYCKSYDEAIKYQQENYGVVGWESYTRDIAFGNWNDAEVRLGKFDIYDENGITTIFMYGQTPWVPPYLWLEYIKHTFGLNVFHHCEEETEGSSLNSFEEIDGPNNTVEDYFAKSGIVLPDWHEEYDNLEDYAEALARFFNLDNFYDYVLNYKLNKI